MAWTETTRAKYDRVCARYASDLTDGEWAVIARLLPRPFRLGRPRKTDLRAVMNALLFLLTTGAQWRFLPKNDFPPRSTVQHYFYSWRDRGLWRRINLALVAAARRRRGRKAAPRAGVIDSQSVKTTESGGPRGFDAGKKVKGRKRHIVTDTNGALLAIDVQPANVQDSHGAVPLLRRLRATFPELKHIFADRVYRGQKLLNAVSEDGPWTIEIVTRTQSIGTFKAEPKRWVVERTFATVGRNRRLAKDYEASTPSAQAWFTIGHVKLLIRQLTTQ